MLWIISVIIIIIIIFIVTIIVIDIYSPALHSYLNVFRVGSFLQAL